MTPTRDLVERFADREYRQAYSEDFLDTSLAMQIRALREARGWSQDDLAQQMGTGQSRISTLESADYGAWSINTLKKLARAFDVALRVKFESYGELVEELSVFSRDSLAKPGFDADPAIQGVASLYPQWRSSTRANSSPGWRGSAGTARSRMQAGTDELGWWALPVNSNDLLEHRRCG